ncbi:MAG: queuosine salvage family protein [bacterium]|nr:queuosine salvage family protein [bacterium]
MSTKNTDNQIQLNIQGSDPFEILASTREVIREAKFVSINENAVKKTAEKIQKILSQNELVDDKYVFNSDSLEDDIQRRFVEAMMGFCYWAEEGKEKWTIEYPKNQIVKGGWYGVRASFQKEYEKNPLLFSPIYLQNISETDLKRIFEGVNGIDIPLLRERLFIIHETAELLIEHFDGIAINIIDRSQRDAVKLMKILYDVFPLFQDEAIYNKRMVIFLKLAHLFVYLVDQTLKDYKLEGLKNMDQLAVFADYKLPQVLRNFDIIEYKKELADKVDSFILLPQGSVEEIEIRSATIWSIELLRQAIHDEYTSLQIGQAIWLLAQEYRDTVKMKPHHRTYTIYY